MSITRGPSTRLKVLIVSNIFPWPLDRGITQRIHYLTQWFAARHDVTLVSLAEDGDDVSGSPLSDICERILAVHENCDGWGTRLWEPLGTQLRALIMHRAPSAITRFEWPALTRALAKLRAQSSFDLVWTQRAPMAEAARRAGFDKIVVDMADIDSEALTRALDGLGRYRTKLIHRAEAWKLRTYEHSLATRFSGVTVCKEADRSFFGHHASRAVVVPNGVAQVDPLDSALEQPNELLFVGSLGYEPNVDACLRFVRDVLPGIRAQVPGVRFVIVGRTPVDAILKLHDGEGCIVAASVPDVTSYYRRASLVVAPIHLGAGTRLKILEALSLNRAVVSTTMGADGLGLVSGEHIEIADTANSFAAACVRLLQDAATRRKLSASGRQFVMSNYTWDAIAARAEQEVAALVAAYPARAHEESLRSRAGAV